MRFALRLITRSQHRSWLTRGHLDKPANHFVVGIECQRTAVRLTSPFPVANECVYAGIGKPRVGRSGCL